MRRLERLTRRLDWPPALLLAALVIHVLGRLAALCMPIRLDSLYHAVSAYKFWEGSLQLADLIPDKPGGQALLTGWSYRVFPGPPSRLTLIPIESACMLAGYCVLYLLIRRLFGSRIGAACTLFAVIAHNALNALESVTDGFTLGENYLILPVAIAAWAHLTVPGPTRRGVARGLAIGLGLTIKQAAMIPLVVMFADTLACRRRPKEFAAEWAASAVGILIAVFPLGIVLCVSGTLDAHIRQLIASTPRHVGTRDLGVQWHDLVPLVPMAAWYVLGLVAGVFAISTSSRRPEVPPLRPVRSIALFAAAWLALELLAVSRLRIPASHYYQQLVTPASLLAGVGMHVFGQALARLPLRARTRAYRSAVAISMLAVALAALPLLAAFSTRLHRFSARDEAAVFQEWLATWSPGRAADHLWKQDADAPNP